MRLVTGLLLALFIIGCVAPPVDEKKKKEKSSKEHAEDNEVNDPNLEVEYKRYLQEVVGILEGDESFRERLMKADPDDIKTGKIATDLEFVNHNVRTKLDEVKRQELERLRHLAVQQYEHDNGIDRKHMKIPAHLDPRNPHTFEAEDLRKLIVQTTKELEDVDKKRKDEFKEYEMQKELLYQEQLKHMDEKNRVEAEKHHQALQEKHNKHDPLHHPGSKQQYEQVWEEQDHLAPEDFNPKTFFHLHDLDGNGVWDANEVKTLFKKELDKMYDPNAPEDDMRERMEEMERMREHVFNETDTNKDRLISYQEFLDQTKRQEFQRDEGWEPLDQQHHPVYNDEEYKKYQKQHEEEIRRMIEQGLLPNAPPGYHMMPPPPGYHPGQGQGHPGQGHPEQGHPGQGLAIQGQGHHDPGNGQQHLPPGMPPNGVPHPGQGGYHPQQGMHYQQGAHPNQMQHGQFQAPPQQYHGQGQGQQYHGQDQGQQYHGQDQYHPAAGAVPQQYHPNAAVGHQGAPQAGAGYHPPPPPGQGQYQQPHQYQQVPVQHHQPIQQQIPVQHQQQIGGSQHQQYQQQHPAAPVQASHGANAPPPPPVPPGSAQHQQPAATGGVQGHDPVPIPQQTTH